MHERAVGRCTGAAADVDTGIGAELGSDLIPAVVGRDEIPTLLWKVGVVVETNDPAIAGVTKSQVQRTIASQRGADAIGAIGLLIEDELLVSRAGVSIDVDLGAVGRVGIQHVQR